MARRVEEIQRVRRNMTGNGQEIITSERQRTEQTSINNPEDYEEEYYDVSDNLDSTENGLNTASGVLALLLIVLAVYLVWLVLH